MTLLLYPDWLCSAIHGAAQWGEVALALKRVVMRVSARSTAASRASAH